MLYIKRDILASSTYSFCNGKSVSKDIENIQEIIAEFKVFKGESRRNEIICNMIQNSISLWKDELETVVENNKNTCSIEKSYYWLRYDGFKKIISMNPHEHLDLFFKMKRDIFLLTIYNVCVVMLAYIQR